MSIPRPSGLKACVIGNESACPGSPNTPELPPDRVAFQRVLDRSQLLRGPAQADRRRTTARRAGRTEIPTNRFIDPTELANGVSMTYRVRVNSPTEGMSDWSKKWSKTAVNTRTAVGGAPACRFLHGGDQAVPADCYGRPGSPTMPTRTARHPSPAAGSSSSPPGQRHADADRQPVVHLTRARTGSLTRRTPSSTRWTTGCRSRPTCHRLP